jgi:hypothetical protein
MSCMTRLRQRKTCRHGSPDFSQILACIHQPDSRHLYWPYRVVLIVFSGYFQGNIFCPLDNGYCRPDSERRGYPRSRASDGKFSPFSVDSPATVPSIADLLSTVPGRLAKSHWTMLDIGKPLVADAGGCACVLASFYKCYIKLRKSMDLLHHHELHLAAIDGN